jgi:hypothetical protein
MTDENRSETPTETKRSRKMNPIIIGLSLFAVAIVVMAIYARNSTLAKLEPFPGEETLYEEDGVEVHQAGRNRPSRFPGCTVRITNKRLIVAQKSVFGSSKPLRHIAVFEPREAVEKRPHVTLSGAYVTVVLEKNSIVVKPNASPPHISFPIDGTALTAGQSVLIFSQNLDAYKKHFRIEQ